MRVIVAGSRTIANLNRVDYAIRKSGFPISKLVCGMARNGVDMIAVLWADLNQIPIAEFPAAWRDRDGVYNPGAGFQRNKEMAEYADALVAVWDGASSGTRDMIERAQARGLPVHVDTVENARFFE